MEEPSDQATFFNILDTHDGIGLMGAKGILSPEEIQKIIDGARQNGALVSYKSLEGGSEEPYEINSTWWSAINGEDDKEGLELKVRRYVASRSISLMLQGVPAVYIHGAIGSGNDWETYAQTNHKRDLNRALIEIEAIKAAAQDPDSKISRLGAHMQKLNLLRVSQPAFHPHGAQRVLDLAPEVFALKRTSPQGDQHLLALTNVSDRPCQVSINLNELSLEETVWRDLVAEAEHKAQGGILSLELSPYQVAWLCPAAGL
jgi:sucrose phosphorylase